MGSEIVVNSAYLMTVMHKEKPESKSSLGDREFQRYGWPECFEASVNAMIIDVQINIQFFFFKEKSEEKDAKDW